MENKEEQGQGKVREGKRSYKPANNRQPDDFEAAGGLFAQHRVMFIMALLLSVILIAVFVLQAVGVIPQWLANCIYIPLLIIVIIVYLVAKHRNM